MKPKEQYYIPSERDWKEDFITENGNYWCRCAICNKIFLGYKRRMVCKKCATSGYQDIQIVSKVNE